MCIAEHPKFWMTKGALNGERLRTAEDETTVENGQGHIIPIGEAQISSYPHLLTILGGGRVGLEFFSDVQML